MKILAVAAAMLLASCSAADPAPDLSIDGAWARPTVAGQSSSAAYFVVVNKGGADRLVSVTSPVADATLHSMTLDDGIMRMRPLEGLDIPARSTVELKPSGDHVMLMDLKTPLPAGDTVPLRVRFEKSGEKAVAAQVREGAAR